MLVQGKAYRTVWMEGGSVKMIEQRLLPHEFTVVSLATHCDTAEAIKTMVVRGAGAIGAAAGFAMAQAALEAPACAAPGAAGRLDDTFQSYLERAAGTIRSTRPTAHDLFFSVEHVLKAASSARSHEQGRRAAVTTAQRLADENAQAGERIGIAGVALLRSGMRILTHCNAGWLAFVDWGSALAPIYQAQQRGIEVSVYVPETRPRSQGAKLTAWELGQAGVQHTVIADTAIGSYFQRKQIDAVIVGADRIAANGDVANKIGTYTIALLAKQHGVPFYVAAPRSTVDPKTPDGAAIVIEERGAEEVAWVSGRSDDGTLTRVQITPTGSPAGNPAFDVTPAALVTAFITEAGLLNHSQLVPFARGRLTRCQTPVSDTGV